jgi:transposase
MPHFPLSDEDWAKIERRDPRPIIEAIFWITETGAKWHHLPSHYPPAQTCYIKWLEWKKAGLMSKVMDTLDIGTL